MYYVYKLIDPRDNSVFYVGKGKDNRMYKHEKSVRVGRVPNGNKNLFNKIKEIIDLRLDIIYVKVFESSDEKQAYSHENSLINEIGVDNLCNVVDDKMLIGMCSNTKNSNWYFNSITNEYKLFKKNDIIPLNFEKGSPKTKTAMLNWWSKISEEELLSYKQKMSISVKNSESHRLKLQTEEYRTNLSNGLLNSDKFKEYNKNRSKRGKYKPSEKNKNRQKKSILIKDNNIIKEFNSLSEVCEYFNIKTSTACIWIKNEKVIDDMILKSK